jgi:hypothetical protein
MPRQDRTGSNYEKLLAFSLEVLGFRRSSDPGKNYQQPSKNSEIIIPDTYIQPDLVVRSGEEIQAVLYSTHWSETRSSKKKFWRTWEELAQQRIVLGDEFISVNCLFEALPAGMDPLLCRTVDDLPLDATRDRERPLQIEGWDAGNGWALIESFDVNILFPKGYAAVADVSFYEDGNHDENTTKLLKEALHLKPKNYFAGQWDCLRVLRNRSQRVRRGTPDTKSRYRIGLLHVYLLGRLFSLRSGRNLELREVVQRLAAIGQSEPDILDLRKQPPFDQFPLPELQELLNALAGVYVRRGQKPQFFCKVRTFSVSGKELKKISFNKDFIVCLGDLAAHVGDTNFIHSIETAFKRFDSAFGVAEAMDDLAHPKLVEKKATFVESELLSFVNEPRKLAERLWQLRDRGSNERDAISSHVQNWHFEMLLYYCGLNSAEHIQTRFKENFEKKGHKLRPHAPYGGHAQTVAFMLQGRDVCEQWHPGSRGRTLEHNQFRMLCWASVAESISQAIKDHGYKPSRANEDVVILYLQNKSTRIISSDLNGFSILIEHYLGDLCHFIFREEEEANAGNALGARVRRSWHTDMVNRLWGGSPLATWMEGVSRDGEWLVKVQSAQDGNEGHKTKELAGRCRAFHLDWVPAANPAKRSDWNFSLRRMPKAALVLDGDWYRMNKKNLYEAGWDWVGDVTELEELRQLIQQR